MQKLHAEEERSRRPKKTKYCKVLRSSVPFFAYAGPGATWLHPTAHNGPSQKCTTPHGSIGRRSLPTVRYYGDPCHPQPSVGPLLSLCHRNAASTIARNGARLSKSEITCRAAAQTRSAADHAATGVRRPACNKNAD